MSNEGGSSTARSASTGDQQATLPSHLSSLTYLFGGSLVDPRLRASNEHILIVRVPRAGGRPGCPLPLSCGFIPARDAGLNLPASNAPLIHFLNPSIFLNSHTLFPLPLTGIPVAQASDHRQTAQVTGKEVIQRQSRNNLKTFYVSPFTFYPKKEMPSCRIHHRQSRQEPCPLPLSERIRAPRRSTS